MGIEENKKIVFRWDFDGEGHVVVDQPRSKILDLISLEASLKCTNITNIKL
jgi:uncharacterized protein YndB with AHSA1/START domain